jgi:hypothetical protein
MRRNLILLAALCGGITGTANATVIIDFRPITVTDPDASPLRPGETPLRVPTDNSGNTEREFVFYNNDARWMIDFHVRMSSGTKMITILGSPFFKDRQCEPAPGRSALTLCDTAASGDSLVGIRPGESFVLTLTNFDVKDHIFNVTPSYANVPEPGTWAMMVIGFGLVGVRRRRRSRAAA